MRHSSTCHATILGALLFCAASAALDAQAQPKKQPAAAELAGPYRILGDLRAFDFPMMTVEISPDRKWLAASGNMLAGDLSLEAKLRLVDVASGQAVHDLEGHQHLANRLRFSPDSKTLYSGGNPHNGGAQATDANLCVWDVATGKQRKSMMAPLWDLSPDGKVLVIAENTYDIDPGFFIGRPPGPTFFTLRFLDTTTWKEIARHVEKEVILANLCFSPDGKTVALAVTADSTIRIWDWQGKKETGRLQAPKLTKDDYVTFTHLQFHPDGKRLATVTDSNVLDRKDRKVVLWDIASRKVARTFTTNEYPIMALAFSPKGDRLVVSPVGSNCPIFNVASGERLKALTPEGGPNFGALLGFYRAGLTPEATARLPEFLTALWDVAIGKDTHSLKSRDPLSFVTPEQWKAYHAAAPGSKVLHGLKYPGKLSCQTMAPDNRTVAAGDFVGVIRIWDVTTGKETARFTDPAGMMVASLAYAEGGKRLLSHHQGGKVLVWDTATGKQVGGLPGSDKLALGSLAVSAGGKVACAITNTNQAMVWKSLTDPRPVQIELPGSDSPVQFTPDGSALLTCRWFKGPVHLVDVDSGRVLRRIGRDEVKAFAIAPDGSTLATYEGTSDYKSITLRLWDFGAGQEKHAIDCREAGIAEASSGSGYVHHYGLCFTADSRALLVHTRNGVGVWDVATGKNRLMLGGQGNVTVAPTGRLVCTQGPNCVLVWDLGGRQQKAP